MIKKLAPYATKPTIAVLLMASILVLISTTTIAYKQIYLDEKRTFWSTISNNLATEGVTRSTFNESGSRTIEQVQQTGYAGRLSVRNLVTLTTVGDDKTQRVVVETRGFEDGNFLRYNNFELPNVDDKKKVEDAIGVWARSGEEGQVTPELLQESMLSSFVLFGNLEPSARQQIVSQLHNAYEVDFSQTVVTQREGRTTYEYSVQVNIREFGKVFADYLRLQGLDEAAELVGSGSDTDYKVPVKMVIDARSRRVVEASADNGPVESYTAYGVDPLLERPQAEVGYDELQKRLAQ